MRLNNIVGITDRSKAGLVLIGEPGAGKSAVVSSAAAHRRRRVDRGSSYERNIGEVARRQEFCPFNVRNFLQCMSLFLPSRPREFHPEPLTEPDLILSHHPARAIARRLPPSAELSGSSWFDPVGRGRHYGTTPFRIGPTLPVLDRQSRSLSTMPRPGVW